MSDAWMNGGQQWLPDINAAELRYGIPMNLLARCAFQECSWRDGVVIGMIPSSAGALGILQLMPRWFPSVRVPVPFTRNDTLAQIAEAGELLAGLHRTFGDWQLAVAAYNWGQGDVEHAYAMDADQYKLADMPTQTQNYVREVFADVPQPGVLLT